jgi:hypothetical protein
MKKQFRVLAILAVYASSWADAQWSGQPLPEPFYARTSYSVVGPVYGG